MSKYSSKKILAKIIILFLLIAQANASMMQYNAHNQIIRVDNQSMTYGPKGYLASVDSVNILHQLSGIVEHQDHMVATTFGGVRIISNGVYQTIFTDNKNVLKTVSDDDKQQSYTDPYGNSVQQSLKDKFPLERNRMTFDGGYQINDDLINFNARSYMPSLKIFTSMDSYNVANRYNFSDGNPIMKFDPSGHNAQTIINYVLNGIGIIAGIASAGFSVVGWVGVASGITGILSNVATSKNKDEAKLLQVMSSVLGGMSFVSDIGAVALYMKSRNARFALNVLDEELPCHSMLINLDLDILKDSKSFTSQRASVLLKPNKYININNGIFYSPESSPSKGILKKYVVSKDLINKNLYLSANDDQFLSSSRQRLTRWNKDRIYGKNSFFSNNKNVNTEIKHVNRNVYTTNKSADLEKYKSVMNKLRATYKDKPVEISFDHFGNMSHHLRKIDK